MTKTSVPSDKNVPLTEVGNFFHVFYGFFTEKTINEITRLLDS